jgi:hypothetical protein
MSSYSIDLETAGINVESTILSFGICEFVPSTGKIIRTLEVTFDIDSEKTINCTLGTIRFWLNQATENPEAVSHVFANQNKVSIPNGLQKLTAFLKADKTAIEVWANGTKFDLGMMEYLYKKHDLKIPWSYNSDRCMRTLRGIHGNMDVDMGEFEEIPHTALSDAIRQAKYISACLSYVPEPLL